MDEILKPGMDGDDVSTAPLSILCVDDEENVLRSLKRLFRTEAIPVLTATSGKEGLAILHSTENIGLIMSDQQMPEMTGTVFLRAAAALRPDIPRMILTGHSDVTAAIAAINEGGAYRFLTKPWNEADVVQAVRDGLQRYLLIQENFRLNQEVRRQKDELEEWNVNLKNRVLQQTAVLRIKREEAHQQNTRIQTITDVSVATVLTFTDLLDQRNHRLSYHSRTVAALAVSMAGTLALPHAQVEEIRRAALLHDIGLGCVSDRMLSLSTKQMSPEDLEKYRNHSVMGQEIMAISEELQGIWLILRHHREEFDGSGFPDGLAGELIPLGARIIHVASFIDQTFAAESGTDPKYQTVRKLAASTGSRFDPALFAAANRAVQEVLATPRHTKGSGRTGSSSPESADRNGIVA